MNILPYIISLISGAFFFILNKISGRGKKTGKKLSIELIEEKGKEIVLSKGNAIPTGEQINIRISVMIMEYNLQKKWVYTVEETLKGIYVYIDKFPGFDQNVKENVLKKILRNISEYSNQIALKKEN